MSLFMYAEAYFTQAAEEPIMWNGNEYASEDEVVFPRGRIHYYSYNTEVCNSWVLVPGTALLPIGLLAICHCLSLIYLFLGIGIVSDIFMDGIEKITSQTSIITVTKQDGSTEQRKVTVWNPTVANLTLMALGSSAPEILLSVIETASNLGECPGELGASTIVGSAAFNLLVIAGVSIYAVSEDNDNDPERDDTVPLGVKKINDMGVFAITATSSIWAYVWLFIVLIDSEVQLWEAWLTLAFFFVLIIMAFGADKYKASKDKLLEKDDEKNGIAIDFSAMEIFRELVNEKQGNAANDKQSVEKRERMKKILKDTMNTDKIDNVNFE